MTAEKFIARLNRQIGNEFAAHQQYVACAIYFDSLVMPQVADFFYRQALEERDHAMMMARYLLDSDAQVEIPAVEAPQSRFASVIEPVELALAQERRVTEQIFELMTIARAENDFASEQFTQWFIKEQVEETATMSDLLAVVRRAPDNVEAIEDYVQREQGAGSGDPTAPRVAGA